MKSKCEDINLLNVSYKWLQVVLNVILDMEMGICVVSTSYY